MLNACLFEQRLLKIAADQTLAYGQCDANTEAEILSRFKCLEGGCITRISDGINYLIVTHFEPALPLEDFERVYDQLPPHLTAKFIRCVEQRSDDACDLVYVKTARLGNFWNELKAFDHALFADLKGEFNQYVAKVPRRMEVVRQYHHRAA